ncbi:MAG TPA: tetratricopeptide repeat protein [Terriglobales bacterium]|nr:tetratricopeptide repeat protein [Terriglobales bacterium]
MATKPQDAHFLVQTGNELKKREQYDAALGAFLSAVQLKPDAELMARAQFGIGSVYNAKDNLQAAIAPLREAIRLKPDYTEAHIKLAAVYYRLKQYPDSIAEYKIAIRLDPNDGWKYYTLGLSYKEAGRKDLATSAWKQVLTFKEKDKDMLSLTGSELYEIQEYDLAFATYRAALTASQPEDANDNDGFGTALLNAGVYEGMAKVYFARKQYGEIVKLAESLPQNASFFPHELGNAYVAINQFAKAVKVFEEAATDDAQNVAESLYDLGHCYNLMGRKPDARRIYAKLRGIEQGMALKLLTEINQK